MIIANPESLVANQPPKVAPEALFTQATVQEIARSVAAYPVPAGKESRPLISVSQRVLRSGAVQRTMLRRSPFEDTSRLVAVAAGWTLPC